MSITDIQALLEQYWGYASFRPHQREAIDAILSRRDSVTILPTGGGKSLCYQLPALLFGEATGIVISPLIALMKDQVDTANSMGIVADTYNSSLTPLEQKAVWERFSSGQTRLLYLSPERFAVPEFMETLQLSGRVAFIAIDEAHCISQWGHDFRPDYRQLSRLRDAFPGVGIHAFTATATPQVQQDMQALLNLRSPQVLVGDYERANLRYQAIERPAQRDLFLSELTRVMDRHPNEAGIIYCISRAEVDQLSADLSAQGYSALPYHAGLSDKVRRANQDAFMSESVDIMVATVAFGMGIDRSNIRYVVHTGMPKSLEHYQQEAGRAGRDGLASDCILFYGGKDAGFWYTTFRTLAPEARAVSARKLEEMTAYARTVICRQRYLVEYFGQPYAKKTCGTCDVCLGAHALLDGADLVAKKILSCVWRVGQDENATTLAQVLAGKADERLSARGYDRLSTFGLLADHSRKDIKTWVDQLVGQRLLLKEPDFGALRLSASGQQFLKASTNNEGSVVLSAPSASRRRQAIPQQHGEPPSGESYTRRSSSSRETDWEGVDMALFEALRACRKRLAQENSVPAFIVFGDDSLRAMAREKPTTPQAFLQIHGVGYKKFEQYGEAFLAELRGFLQEKIILNPSSPAYTKTNRGGGGGETPSTRPNLTREQVFTLLKTEHQTDQPLEPQVNQFAQKVGRTPSTVMKYLLEYLEVQQVTAPEGWVEPGAFSSVSRLVEVHGFLRMKDFHDLLGGSVGYDELRICSVLLKNRVAVMGAL